MPKKPLFKGKHVVDTMRMDGWDYGSKGSYFLTMCTEGRNPWFGTIYDGSMRLSTLGLVADECWRAIPRHFPHVSLDAYVIMPDHIHGILTIDECAHATPGGTRFGPQSKNIPSIIRGFKIGVTAWARQNGFEAFAWQDRYHDRLIPDEIAMNGIRRYIRMNPLEATKR